MPPIDFRARTVELKQRHPIDDVAARYVSKLKRSGNHLMACCPFHDDSTPSFAVWPGDGTWHCFGACNIGGDVIDLVGYALYRTAWNPRDPAMFKEAIARLDNSLPPLHAPVPAEWHSLSSSRPVELDSDTQLILDLAARVYHTTLLEMGRRTGTPFHYLRERGFSDETIRREGLGYSTGDLLVPALAAYGFDRDRAAECHLLSADHDYREFMRGRIVFVDRDRSGAVLHMIGRRFASFLSEAAQKYLCLKELSKPLYGYAQLDRRQSDSPVVVVESPSDRLTARQWGFDAVAVIGTGIKEEQARLLARMKRPKLVVPHNDGGTGWRAAEKWRDTIGSLTELAPLPQGIKDLNELASIPDGQRIFNELVHLALAKFETGREILPAGDGSLPAVRRSTGWGLWNLS